MLNHPAFQSPPTRGQFAKQGEWENAWLFPRAELPSPAAVRAYLDGRSEIAFEAFFGEAFFGLRFMGEAESVEDVAAICLEALRSAKSVEQFLSILRRSTNLDGWAQRMSFAEIGATNSWKSVGAFHIADLRAAYLNFTSLWLAVREAAIARDTSRCKAIEFAFDKPIPHWFALPVSTAEPPYELSSEMLHAALSSAASLGLHATRTTQ